MKKFHSFIKQYLPACITVIVSIVLIIIGIIQKQPNDILTKAIRICLECVGIG